MTPSKQKTKAGAGESPARARSFADLGLSHQVLSAVERGGFDAPTEIQAQFIPAALTGRDCLGQAQTGTGKTAAFLLPVFELLARGENVRALILAPTRELAKQITAESKMLAGKHPPAATAVYGGQPIKRQIERLRSDPEIVSGTPGRLIDHHKRGTIAMHSFTTVILDEVDRMFDMGFRRDIAYILRQCENRRQTLFLSATMPDPIMKLAERHTHDPLRISVVDESAPSVASLDQAYFSVAEERKQALLLELIRRDDPRLGLVFTRTKNGCEKLGRSLRKRKLAVRWIHGDMPQQKREKALNEFRQGEITFLVATDVMGRGIDVPGVSHVINYDIPRNPDDYLHRTGRSARMNAPGKAYTFVTPEEGDELTAVEILCNTLLKKDEIPDFDNGVKRRPRKRR